MVDDTVIEIRPGEDGRLYVSLYRKKPFWWKKLDDGRWLA